MTRVKKVTKSIRGGYRTRGFALPTILISSIVMLMVLLVSVTSTTAVRTAIKNQYYTQLARAAGEAGTAYAKACMAANGGTPQWTNSNPLKPNTDCEGVYLVGFSCTPTSTDVRCYVALNGNIRSSFSVPAPTGSQSVSATGTVSLLRTSNNAVWRTYTQNTMQNTLIPPTAPVNLTFDNTTTGRSGTIQTWTVPATGTYTIETWGAQGGNSGNGYSGGLGVRMRGDFALTKDQTIKILVGQQGIGGPNSQAHFSGGGGGGTFVQNQTTSTLLIASGGGGGGYFYSGAPGTGIDGTTATSGTAGQGGIAGGSGGAGGTCSNGGCSAGYSGNGTYGAQSFLSATDAGFGGLMQTSWGDYSLHGGFGGGGGAGLPSGGGGGYSGGGGGTWNTQGAGGGGGSYNSGTNQSNAAGAKMGQGKVTITNNIQVANGGVVTTLAGLALTPGSTDGTGSAARFNMPYGIAVDAAGTLYVADQSNHIIRKITAGAVVTTLAGLALTPGSTDGTGSAARFSLPEGIAVDSAGTLYVVDRTTSIIRKITPGGVVTTLAGLAGVTGSTDGTGSAARFQWPYDIAVDSAGTLYVSDTGNNTIRKITPGGVVTTLAGTAGVAGSTNGTGAAARFDSPAGIAVDSAGTLYVADNYNYIIRKITAGGVVTTLAGLAKATGSTDGTGSAARFNNPYGIAVDSAGTLYVTDQSNFIIRKITAGGVVTTLAGGLGVQGSTDGTGSAARFKTPTGIAIDAAGTLYVTDYGNHIIRKIR